MCCRGTCLCRLVIWCIKISPTCVTVVEEKKLMLDYETFLFCPVISTSSWFLVNHDQLIDFENWISAWWYTLCESNKKDPILGIVSHSNAQIWASQSIFLTVESECLFNSFYEVKNIWNEPFLVFLYFPASMKNRHYPILLDRLMNFSAFLYLSSMVVSSLYRNGDC